ncbi:hypothetical protein HanRHA438_Chr10g0464041 [Helianthus annuus]|nr:hypothetical protein HanRHA438_Chr10g0464041 [Helianthus annuus]
MLSKSQLFPSSFEVVSTKSSKLDSFPQGGGVTQSELPAGTFSWESVGPTRNF